MRISTTRNTRARWSLRTASKLLKPVAALAFWLFIWWLISLAIGKALILPSPATVAKTLGRLCTQSEFWRTAGNSLLKIFLGFIAGVLAGVGFAVLTSCSKAADMLVSPFIRVIRATPVASFIILVILWVTRSLVPSLMSALMVLPVVWGGLCTAIKSTDIDLLEMAKTYGFGRLKTLRLVYIPSVLPAFLSSCLTAQGLAWKSGVAAEVLCLPSLSIGTQLYNSKIYLETADLFAWTAVVIILSFLLEKLCRVLVRRYERT